ncbi:unnamed protein product [Closterium sp. NIES-53]
MCALPHPRALLRQLREWLVRSARLQNGATGARGAGAAGAGGAGVSAGAGVPGGTAATGPGSARTRGSGADGTGCDGGAGAGDPTESGATGAGSSGAGAGRAGVGGTGAGGAGAGGVGAVDPRGTVRLRPYFVPLHQQVLGVPYSPLLAPSPYNEQTGGLTKGREPASRPASPGRRIPRPRPPPVPGTHAMTHRPSSVPLRVPLPAPPESSLPAIPDPEADRIFHCCVWRLDYATFLVAEFESASPPSIRNKCALGTNVLEDTEEDFDCLAAAVPHFASMLLAPEGDPDAPDIPTLRSHAEAITGPYSSQWVKRPTGSPPARCCTSLPSVTTSCTLLTSTQLSCRAACTRRSGCAAHLASLDRFLTTLAALGFAPSTADPSLFLRTDTLLPPFYVLVYVDHLVLATADSEALTLVKSELQKRHSCTHLGELRSYLGLQITRDRELPTITLTQSHMVHQVLQRFGFQFSSPKPTPLSTSHLLLAPPSDESVELSDPYPELVGCLMYLMTCTRPDLAYPLSILTRYVAAGRHRKGDTFSLCSGSVSWPSTRSSSVLSSSCEAEIYARAMAAQELRWLTYLQTDLGEQPRSPPVLYVDNKTMIALCQEHRL